MRHWQPCDKPWDEGNFKGGVLGNHEGREANIQGILKGDALGVFEVDALGDVKVASLVFWGEMYLMFLGEMHLAFLKNTLVDERRWWQKP